MASVSKRGNRWFAQVRRKGYPAQRSSFGKKSDAERWARKVEHAFDIGLVGDLTASSRVLMSELFARYQREKVEKKNAKTESYMFKKLDKYLGQLALKNVQAQQVSSLRDGLLAEGLAASTVRNYLHLLSAVIKTALTDWGYHGVNPVTGSTKPPVHNERLRRLSMGEQERLLAAAAESPNLQLRPIIVVAIESAMRLGELLRIKWSDIDWDRRFVHLPKTKNHYERNVPLSIKAVEALKSVERKEDRVFCNWLRSDSFNKGWRGLLRRAEIDGLRFHDLRHEACSRMTERGLSPLEVSRISGHRSMQMLRRYSHFSIEHLVGVLDGGRKPNGEDE